VVGWDIVTCNASTVVFPRRRLELDLFFDLMKRRNGLVVFDPSLSLNLSLSLSLSVSISIYLSLLNRKRNEF
jgi:hypothetical protein